jgi:ectoine hydroxylase-related dioxygenase (phytanoyl-CoA dioxygenase family)
MALRATGPFPGDMVGVDPGSSDPLLKFPRMIHMHRWDETSRQWMTDPRIAQCLTAFFGAEPYAVQTMLYFKPAGARGQALHQDNWYLRVKPGTCTAAWLALDDCDEENGCMQVVPGSHAWPTLCSVQADTTESFTGDTVPLPEGFAPKPVVMRAGDVLFFNGQIVHGSYPNRSQDRFRRALIGHYVDCHTEQLTKFDQPVVKMDGTDLELGGAEEGGPCGVWVAEDGQPVIEMAGRMPGGAKTE